MDSRVLGLAAVVLLASCGAREDAMRQEASEPTVEHPGVVTVNGIGFTWFAEGKGPTCVIVGDGLPFARAVSDRLKAQIRFLTLNSRLTTPEAQVGDVSGMTMDTLVDDIEQARQALDLGRICLIGHSISGLIALEYARAYPENVTYVVMHSTPPYYGPALSSALRAYWDETATPERRAAREAARERVTRDSLSKLPPSESAILSYVNNASTYFHDPTYDPAWILEGDYWNEDAWNQLFQVIMKGYDMGDGPPVQAPVFLAIGRDDYAVPYTVWDAAERAKIPDLSYHLFDRSGHYSALEEQDLFDQMFLEWVNGLYGSLNGRETGALP